MKKIFRYYDDNNWIPTINIKVVADDIEEAIDIIWDYLGKSTDYNRNYFERSEVVRNTKECKLIKSGIFSDESKLPII